MIISAEIQDIEQYYENYRIKIVGNWFFVSPEDLKKWMKGKRIKGNIETRRTRTWITPE